MKNNSKIPKFKTEDEERVFWDKHSFADFQDQFKQIELDLSELRPSTQSVTIRMPVSLLASLKKVAHKNDVPYQSLMKIMLQEQVKKYKMM